MTEALRLLRRTTGCDIDLVICMGDDQTDESMFEAAEEYVNEARMCREAVGLDDDDVIDCGGWMENDTNEIDYMYYWQ